MMTLINRRHLMYLGAIMLLSWITVFTGHRVVQRVVELHFLELPANPYFQPADGGLLYLLTPLVVISSLVMWLYPGLLLALTFGNTTRWTELLVKAFAISLVTYFVLITSVKLVTPIDRSPLMFAVAVAIGSGAALVVLALRVRRGAHVTWPFSQPQEIRRFVWSLLIPLLVLWLMLPVLFWQDLHDDAFEALEVGRSLSRYFWVRFPNPTGVSGLGVGMIPMAFPIQWFISLFGNVEAAARLPMLLYLPVVFCLLLELVEWKSRRSLGLLEEVLLLLGLAIFTITMSYNASYDPYFADIAAPTALEMMTLLCILASVYFLWNGGLAWFYLFAILSYTTRPTGLMVIAILAVVITLVFPEKRRQWLPHLVVAILASLALAFVYDRFFIPWLAGTSSIGYQSSSVLARMRYIRLNDFRRINYILFPSGILPFLSLFLFRWQDRHGRIITLLTTAYFIFFFFQGYIALHHFVPVMVLPLVVFWRLHANNSIRLRGSLLALAGITGLLALWLSLPRSFELNRTVRQIGQKISIRIGDYDRDFLSLSKHLDIFFQLIPPDWQVEDASTELVSGYGSLIYYGTREKPDQAEINYIFQLEGEAAPAGYSQVATEGGASFYVRDQGEWSRDRFQELQTDTRSRLYTIPRSTLFYYYFYRNDTGGQLVIDLKQVMDKILALVR